jgi:hypothetical protein
MELRKYKMVKVPSKKILPIQNPVKSNERSIQLLAIPLAVECINPFKVGKSKLIFVSDIRDIKRGQNTSAFELFGKDPFLEDRSFSVIYFDGVKYGTLSLSKHLI